MSVCICICITYEVRQKHSCTSISAIFNGSDMNDILCFVPFANADTQI